MRIIRLSCLAPRIPDTQHFPAECWPSGAYFQRPELDSALTDALPGNSTLAPPPPLFASVEASPARARSKTPVSVSVVSMVSAVPFSADRRLCPDLDCASAGEKTGSAVVLPVACLLTCPPPSGVRSRFCSPFRVGIDLSSLSCSATRSAKATAIIRRSFCQNRQGASPKYSANLDGKMACAESVRHEVGASTRLEQGRNVSEPAGIVHCSCVGMARPCMPACGCMGARARVMQPQPSRFNELQGSASGPQNGRRPVSIDRLA